MKRLIPILAALTTAAVGFWLFAERPHDDSSPVALARPDPVTEARPSVPLSKVVAPAPTPAPAPAATQVAVPPRRQSRLPSVQIVQVPEARQFDAPGTGDPYFTHKLRRWIERAGVSAKKIRMKVTRSHLILTGSVNSEAARAQVAAVVDARTPRQLTIDNRIVFAGPLAPSPENRSD
jgi:hypothetical protein